ncbi:14560_t:CDS:2, partial [Dentiscutata erythropus]
MPSLKKLVAKITNKSNVATRSIPPQEQIYDNAWSDFEQGEEWNVEEPSGSTGIKEDFGPSSMQAERENPSVVVIEETLFKSYTFEFLLLRLNLSEGDVVRFIDPCLVHYSQALISNVFQMGNDLDNTIQDLLDGK